MPKLEFDLESLAPAGVSRTRTVPLSTSTTQMEPAFAEASCYREAESFGINQ